MRQFLHIYGNVDTFSGLGFNQPLSLLANRGPFSAHTWHRFSVFETEEGGCQKVKTVI